MHITQTVSSDEIVNSQAIHYTRIANSESGGIFGSGLYKSEHFNMKGDARLEQLVTRLQEIIGKNSWRIPENERQVCETTVRLLQSHEFYGPYSVEAGRNPHIASLYDKRSDLKDFKTGELVCKQQAAVASYVLHRAGIPNDFCIGPTGTMQGAVRGHAFVQTRTGNIVEATNPLFTYGESLNHQMIRDGHVAIVKLGPGIVDSYGGGNMPGIEAVKYTFSHHKIQMLTKTVIKNIEAEGNCGATDLAHVALKAAAREQPSQKLKFVDDGKSHPPRPSLEAGKRPIVGREH